MKFNGTCTQSSESQYTLKNAVDNVISQNILNMAILIVSSRRNLIRNMHNNNILTQVYF